MYEDGSEPSPEKREPLLGIAGSSLLRATLLFGSAAAALALILTPMADRLSSGPGVGIDYVSTGSIDRSTYTIRRSVLQAAGTVCILRADGSRRGDC